MVARTYLIHRGDWPEPRGEDPTLFLRPPGSLARTGSTWESLELSRETLDAKQRALETHRTQLPLAGSFLRAFLRRNELFGVPDDPTPRADPVFPDSLRDRWLRSACGRMDFEAVEARVEDGCVRLTARLRETPAPWADYRLYWKPLDLCLSEAYTRSERGVLRNGPEVGVTLPRASLRGSGTLIVAATSRAGGFLIDQTPWRVLRLRVATRETVSRQ